MATIKILILSVLCLYVYAIVEEPTLSRNTIFGDERLKGGIFEHIDDFSDILLFYDGDNPYRLPNTTRPVHYNLEWHIDVERKIYSGIVGIQLVATESGVHEIVIHTSHTELTLVELTQGTTLVPQLNRIDLQYYFLRVTTSTPLNFDVNDPVVYTLTISFEAEMRTDMFGIYPSWFVNPQDDQINWMASTQFSPTAARHAFPCYDEPGFKATFSVTIRRPKTHKSWFCTRKRETVESDIPDDEFEVDIYHTTPVMSTYLIGFVVADYENIVHEDNGLLTFEVIARPAAIQAGQGEYAFDVGQELLAKMSEITDIDYYSVDPNLKLTQAAIPDFSFGAMENWGLITYRENNIMYDEAHTSGHFKQVIVGIMAHEIAHLWYGNLVTPDSWDVVWLKEGFARYYQYFLSHLIKDDLGFETRFITEQVQTALLSDSSNNPHPLTNPGTGSPEQVMAMFSTLTYNKGASIIRMTEHLLGSDVLKQGLRNYLNTRYLQNARPIDLFEVLQEAGVQTDAFTAYQTDFSFIDYYRSWTEQAGHPVLTVQVNHQTGQMFVTQGRFNINTGYSTSNNNWIVPVTFATARNPDFDNTKPTHIIKDSLAVINRGSVGDEWVIFNKQQSGFYRVNYDDYTWELIVRALKSDERTRIHEYNRAQIVDDVFQFARSGIMTYTRAFTILSFLEFETAYAPWVAAVSGFSWIRNRFAGTPQLIRIETMIARWAARIMNEITYYSSEDESFMTSYLRYQLAPTMCAINVRACRIAANAQFRALVDSGIEVAVDNRQFVYCNGLREGTASDFDLLWNRFQEHGVYTEKVTLLQSLGCTPFEESLTTFLNAITAQDNDFIIRGHDYTTALNSAATGNEGNTQILFNFIQNNLETLQNSLTTPLSYVSSRLRTEEEVDKGWTYEQQLVLGDEYRNVFNAAETTRQSIRWAAGVSSDLDNYFLNNEAFWTDIEAKEDID